MRAHSPARVNTILSTMTAKSPIGIIGVGWVGLVSASCFAELGHDVWCRDIDADRIADMRVGNVPIFEPGLTELVAKNSELSGHPIRSHRCQSPF